MIAGMFVFRNFQPGDRAVVFASAWDGDLASCFVAPRIPDQARYAMSLLTSVKPDDLSILRTSEAGRAAQLALYERIALTA